MKSRSLPLLAALGLSFLIVAGAPEQKDAPAIKPESLEKIRAALPESAPGKAAKTRKILVFSKTNGFRHGSIPVGIKAVAELGAKTGAFSVVHSEDESMFEPDKLEDFDAVLMLNTTGEVFRPKDLPEDEAERTAALEREKRLKKSLVDFVKGGKGLAGIHSATDTYKKWDDYNDMMGGAFVGHPWHEKVPVKNLDPNNAITKMFGGNGFEITDEIYEFRNGTAASSDRRMLLSLDGDKMDLGKGSRKDSMYPISWLDDYGKGRVFYCSLGHRDEIYWNPVVLQHYLAGLQFVLGDLEAEATPKAAFQISDRKRYIARR